MSAGPTVALFDLDGTLTVGDTFLPYLRYQSGGWHWASPISLIAPWIAGYKAGAVTAQALKERFLGSFLAGRQVKPKGAFAPRHHAIAEHRMRPFVTVRPSLR